MGTANQPADDPRCHKCGLGVDVKNCATDPLDGSYYHYDCADGAFV